MNNSFPEVSLTDLLEKLPIPVLLVDPQGAFYFNPAFSALTGWQSGHFHANMPENRPDWLQQFFIHPPVAFPSLEEGSPDWAPCVLKTPEGPEVKTFFRQAPLPDGIRLFTFRMPASDLQQTQDDFVSIVSHEFRTPLTSIKGFADTLLRYGSQLEEEQQKRFVTIIRDQADRLTRLVENLLTVSKLGGHQIELNFRPIDLPKALDRVIQNFQAKGSQEKSSINRLYQVHLQSGLPPVWGDPDKLEQILINLIENAVKYSFPETPIDIQTAVRQQYTGEEEIDIAISNQGIGIPPEQISGIFTKFSRVDNPLTRQVEGTGLGLYITQALVKAMRGRITVQSIPNGQTTFTVILPAATPEKQALHHRKPYSEAS